MELWRGSNPCCVCVRADGVDGLQMMAGNTGCGVRRVPLSFKAAVELIQAVCQSQVVSRVGGFGFVVCDLSKTFPDSLSML